MGLVAHVADNAEGIEHMGFVRASAFTTEATKFCLLLPFPSGSLVRDILPTARQKIVRCDG
jgi:hypothetical protein